MGIAQATERCTRLLSGPQLVPDVDTAWARFERQMDDSNERAPDRVGVVASAPWRRPRLLKVSLRTGVLIAAAGAVVVGTAAAATITTVFAPTHVAPVALDQSDLQDIADFMGLGDSHVIGGFSTPSGSRAFPFGTIRWSSSGRAEAGDVARRGLRSRRFPRVASLPSPCRSGPLRGVHGSAAGEATVTFDSSAQGVAGSSVVIYAGPAVAVEYGAASGIDLPTLAVLTMPRPTAVSTGATIGQIEAFLLRQPGISPELAEELRLLGDLGTTLPVPVPAGASVRSVEVGGSPGVLVADPRASLQG